MTDNEIIKALECCKTWNCEKCINRNRAKTATNCRNELVSEIFDLINRQKAEIERLQSRETRWLVIAAHLGRIEELRMKLFKLSGMDLEKLVNCFAAGYILVPPEPPKFDELAKFAEEMTEDSGNV
ncbi:MAG: hypothetical protein IJY73_06320 [Oscillospiraceae bacterium]|nr:hypothetical protein [Oscillospiraceae bacterium]